MIRQTTRFRAAVVQTLAGLGDLEGNIALVQRYVRDAVRQGAELVVLPECMNTGYLFDSAEHCKRLAEPVSGRYVGALAELCRSHDIYIASGITELDELSGKVFNSGVLLDRRGDLALHYHKQFLATHDQNWFAWGERGCPVVDTDLGRIGLLICFDGRIPEIARSLALQGAEIIVDMANFFEMDQAELWVPARAYENGVWFVAATKSGVERSIYYPGGSMIVAPDGDVRARLPYDTHGVITAEIDTRQARDKSLLGGGDRLADRRPESYRLLGQAFTDTPLAGLLSEPLVPERAVTKAAAVQAHGTDTAHSLDEAVEMVAHAARLGVKLIVLPQYFNAPTWCPDVKEAEAAATLAAALRARLAAVATSYGCAIVLPLIERSGDGLAATACLIGPDGETLGTYRQSHLEPEARRWAQPGSSLPVFKTPFGRVGILLGHDGMFPETSRALALAGADVVCWSTAWRHPLERKLLAVPKAADNRVYLVCANRTDSPYPGGSVVISPAGFGHWDTDIAAPPVTRHGAVLPTFMNLALARQKLMIPGVDMVRNRMVHTYAPIVVAEPRGVAA